MIRLLAHLGGLVTALTGGIIFVSSAQAQSTRWVASNGSASTCSRTSPCASFQIAIGAAGVGGEVRCVDHGDYGSFQITDSVTVDCSDVASRAGSILIIAPASAVVVLKGLRLSGQNLGLPRGVSIQGAGQIYIGDIRIDGYAGIASVAGGITFQPTGPAKLVVTNSHILNNGSNGNAVVRPDGGQPATAIFDNVTFSGSAFGVRADGSGQTAGQIDVEVRNSLASGSANNGFIAVSNAGQAQVRFMITRSSAFDNGVFGAVATGSQAFMIVDQSNLAKNGTGLAQLNGSTVATPGNNIVNFNTTNVVGTITPISGR